MTKSLHKSLRVFHLAGVVSVLKLINVLIKVLAACLV